jgi:hypothetical protein
LPNRSGDGVADRKFAGLGLNDVEAMFGARCLGNVPFAESDSPELERRSKLQIEV